MKKMFIAIMLSIVGCNIQSADNLATTVPEVKEETFGKAKYCPPYFEEVRVGNKVFYIEIESRCLPFYPYDRGDPTPEELIQKNFSTDSEG